MIERNLTKNVSNDRILVLNKIEGVQTKDSAGVTQNRLFTSENNKLHALKDQKTNFWKLQWDKGLLSEPLKQQWTSFTKLLNFTSEYLKRRGVEIKEIIDA